MKYLFILLLSISLNAQEIAYALSVKGTVIAQKGSQTIPVKQGDSLEAGIVIVTKEASAITIVFNDASTLVLGANSLLALQTYVFKPTQKEYDFQLSLNKGTLSFESGKIGELSPESFTLKTPEGIVAIRGTKFFIKVQ